VLCFELSAIAGIKFAPPPPFHPNYRVTHAMSQQPKFQNFIKVDPRTLKFQINPFHVSYANGLRRLILSYVESVGFRADMKDDGSTTDVTIIRNDTPMSNEMLAHRVGLLPLNIKDPITWAKTMADKTTFNLKMTNTGADLLDVKAGDFNVMERRGDLDEPTVVPTDKYFPPDPRTKAMRDTALLAVLRPKTYLQGINLKNSVSDRNNDNTSITPDAGESIEIHAKASLGAGREHARFTPVSQCSYEYTRDSDPAKIEALFEKWLNDEKRLSYADLKTDSSRLDPLRREFNTMAVARSYLQDARGEPYSFDFTIETKGALDIEYIVRRACEKGEEMCAKYAGMASGDLPDDVDISPADAEMPGFDFLFYGHDATLGNLLQTYLVENHIDGGAEPKILFAGFKVPHPLRDEMVLRVGVDDRREATARAAVAAAATGCAAIFRQLKGAWQAAIAAETGRPVTPPRGAILAPPPAAPKRTVGARKAPTFVKKTGTVAAPAPEGSSAAAPPSNPFDAF
jgi:DNA-directed RNA polymerase subunit L